MGGARSEERSRFLREVVTAADTIAADPARWTLIVVLTSRERRGPF